MTRQQHIKSLARRTQRNRKRKYKRLDDRINPQSPTYRKRKRLFRVN